MTLSVSLLHKLLSKIWTSEKIPQEWTRGILVKLPKKGDTSLCENWRGITLLSVVSKLITRIMLERMKKQLDKILRENQAGFRANRSCNDQITTLRIIIEQSEEFNASLLTTFVDFEKAFDKLNRKALWNLLKKYGFPEKYITIIQQLYDNHSIRILYENQRSDPVNIETGVRQGCILSPTLFLVAIDWIMRKSTNNTGITWKVFKNLEDLDFADDLCLLSSNKNQMQQKLDLLVANASKVGLKVNQKKTKVLAVNTQNATKLKISNEELEEVSSFNYLGSVITKKGGTEEDVKTRIGKATGAFNSLSNVWNSKRIKTNTKIKIFKSNVMSVLLYGCESWKTTKDVTKKLHKFSSTEVSEKYWVFTGQKLSATKIFGTLLGSKN